MTIIYENDFFTMPVPTPLALMKNSSGVEIYEPLQHITAAGEHFLRSGGPDKDYGIDPNHSNGKLCLMAIFWAEMFGGLAGKLSGLRLLMRCRANEFYLPNPGRIGLLIQSRDKRTYDGKGSTTTVNSFQVKDLICEQLGIQRPFERGVGTAGDKIISAPNWVDITVDLSPNPANFIYLPPEPNDPGSYPPFAPSTAPLDGGLVNIMIACLFDPIMPTYELGSVEGYTPADQGKFDIDYIALES